MTKRILNTYTEYKEPSDIFTEAEQLDQCCEPVSADPCADVGKVETYDSADSSDLDLDGILAAARSANPDKNITGVQLIDKGPTGPCGELHTEWTGRLNCCDDAEPLEIDKDNSVEVLADGSVGVVYLTKRTERLVTVAVHGSGFYASVDGTSKVAMYQGGEAFAVYASGACGSGTIAITDGCSSVVHSVRSTNGRWADVTDTVEGQPLKGAIGEEISSGVFTAISGEWSVTENQGYNIRTDVGPIIDDSGLDIKYFDPEVYFNVGCTSVTACQEPTLCGSDDLIRANYYIPNMAELEPSAPPYLFASIVDVLDGYVSAGSLELHAVSEDIGWLGRRNSTPIHSYSCGANVGAPDGPRGAIDGYIMGYWWFEPVGVSLTIKQWVC
jgi:hypothetical protein